MRIVPWLVLQEDPGTVARVTAIMFPVGRPEFVNMIILVEGKAAYGLNLIWNRITVNSDEYYRTTM